MILKQKGLFFALPIYRATPIPALGTSPAELAYGRRLRTALTSMPSTVTPRTVDDDTVHGRDSTAKSRQRQSFNRREHPLPDPNPGDQVLLKGDGDKGWKLPAEVSQQCAPRSYIVKTLKGDFRRNRKDLRLNTMTESGPAADSEPMPDSSDTLAPESPDESRSATAGLPLQLQPSGPSPSPPLCPSNLQLSIIPTVAELS